MKHGFLCGVIHKRFFLRGGGIVKAFIFLNGHISFEWSFCKTPTKTLTIMHNVYTIEKTQQFHGLNITLLEHNNILMGLVS